MNGFLNGNNFPVSFNLIILIIILTLTGTGLIENETTFFMFIGHLISILVISVIYFTLKKTEIGKKYLQSLFINFVIEFLVSILLSIG
jgi:hypothetical protein